MGCFDILFSQYFTQCNAVKGLEQATTRVAGSCTFVDAQCDKLPSFKMIKLYDVDYGNGAVSHNAVIYLLYLY